MEAEELTYYIDSAYGVRRVDRRKRTRTNKARRLLNNYWLIPVFVLYLELFAIILPPVESPLENLKRRNLYFFRGPVVLYNLISTDFPNTLTGHFKEILLVKKYTFNIDQVSPADILRALKDKESVTKIYGRVIESRGYHNTEIGGVVTLVYESEGPQIHLHEITSLNKAFSEKLHELEEVSVEDFLYFIQQRESMELISKVGIDEHLRDNLIKILSSGKIDEDQKKSLVKGFIRAYDIHSESKFILSPYTFKSFLGSADLEGKYIGLFHFHNNYMEPPSEVDIENSYTDRQFVITLGDKGIVIYDLIKGRETIYRGDLIP